MLHSCLCLGTLLGAFENFEPGAPWYNVTPLFCDMSLITTCALFCSLKFHVVCTCTFFGDAICLLSPDKSENDSNSDCFTILRSVLTYDCWQCFLVSIFEWDCESTFGTDNFLLPNLWVVLCFHLPNLLLTQNLVYPTLFSSVPPPAINHDGSLMMVYDFESSWPYKAPCSWLYPYTTYDSCF